MSEPFLGEIRLFTFGYVPRDWAYCAGQLLTIAANQALFSVLGTTYGGDGRTNFALPNLQGRMPMHQDARAGSITWLGEVGGQESVTLTDAQAPCTVQSDHSPTTSLPNNRWPAQGGAYDTAAAGNMPAVGGGQAHENRSPFLVLAYAIALNGIYPTRD